MATKDFHVSASWLGWLGTGRLEIGVRLPLTECTYNAKILSLDSKNKSKTGATK